MAEESGSTRPEHWCQLIINICYAAIGINAVVLIAIWYFFAYAAPEIPHTLYWVKYIIVPSFVMLAVNGLVHRFVCRRRFPLLYKEYAIISLILFFCTFLCVVHGIAAMLLAAFCLPVFVSSLFANLKMITRWIWPISRKSTIPMAMQREIRYCCALHIFCSTIGESTLTRSVWAERSLRCCFGNIACRTL